MCACVCAWTVNQPLPFCINSIGLLVRVSAHSITDDERKMGEKD